MLSELQSLEGGRHSLLVVTNAAHLHDALIEVLAYFTKKEISGICISLTKPTRFIQSELQAKSIPINKLIFMESMVDESNIYPNVVFIPSLEDLIGMNLAIDSFIKAAGEERFIVLDSIDVLQMYNETEAIVKFIAGLAQRCSVSNVHCIMMISKKNNSFVSQIATVFEKVIYQT